MGDKFLLRVRKSIWYIPTLYASLSIILTILVVMFDIFLAPKFMMHLPKLFFTNVELAKTTLAAIATALLTMTTITFSTIMVVLTTYSTQFSPRTLQDFITDRKTLRVLGIFIGGFLYSILALLFMREWFDDQPVIAAFVGVLLAVLCLGIFVIFIQHVANSIQVSKLIEKLVQEGLDRMERKEQWRLEGKLKYKEQLSVDHFYFSEIKNIKAPSTGYIQLIDVEQWIALAEKYQLFIEFHKQIGDFVTEHSDICSIYFLKEPQKIKEEELYKAVVVGTERTPIQDESFALQKLVEVALRAISPGINDPNTANSCIRYMSKLILTYAKVDANMELYCNDKGVEKVAIPVKTLEDLLYTTFYQIRNYGKEDLSVMFTILECFILVGEGSNQPTKKKLLVMSEYLTAVIKEEGLHPLDCKRLTSLKQHLTKVLNI
ncbi:hypothetical protein BC6307_22285 [Sutcliffiella cohnii]|uniref:DUF2254 domain-containing protein n=1 Tax=Sutcliffiella cohnii TaxID=33932 RepID=A0A223KWK9_9BACI|nr:DUF2254 domain-containing protein [Sutcliffiella cohnii]AST93807.1 hypothetical protein BC6307_22285 [Sutcliffiella cohnii]